MDLRSHGETGTRNELTVGALYWAVKKMVAEVAAARRSSTGNGKLPS